MNENQERLFRDLITGEFDVKPDARDLAEGWRRMQAIKQRHLDLGDPMTAAEAINELYGVLDDQYLNLSIAAIEA